MDDSEDQDLRGLRAELRSLKKEHASVLKENAELRSVQKENAELRGVTEELKRALASAGIGKNPTLHHCLVHTYCPLLGGCYVY